MQQPHVLGVMSLMAIVGGLAFPVFGMMPAFAEEVVQAGFSRAWAFCWRLGRWARCWARWRLRGWTRFGRGRTLTSPASRLPLAVLAFAFTETIYGWPVPIADHLGMALLVLQSMAITLVQVQTDNRVRGRVMTIYSQLHAGSDTMSNVVVGSMAVYIGLPAALALGAAVSFVYAVGLRIAMPAVSRME